MSKHLTQALGLSDEIPDLDELTIEDYLGEEEIDAPTDNPVQDVFASNTELDGDFDAENPLDFSEPEETMLTEPDVIPEQGFIDDQGFDESPELPNREGEETPITDDARQALTAKFIENARQRLLNSTKFQDRANLLNVGAEEDDNAGL